MPRSCRPAAKRALGPELNPRVPALQTLRALQPVCHKPLPSPHALAVRCYMALHTN